MNSRIQHAVRLAVITGAALTIAACASHPKPRPPVAEAPPPPVQSAHLPPAATGPVPGSLQDFVESAGERVYFDYDAFAIRPDAASVLDAQAAWLNRYPAVTVRVEGNADERGTREYNFALGERRANAVRDYLVAHGVAASRLATVSYGKERPIDPGEGEDHWAHNRNGHSALISGTNN